MLRPKKTITLLSGVRIVHGHHKDENIDPTISRVHIVYLGHSHGQDPLVTTSLHVKLLSNVFSSQEEAEEAMVYSYKHGFSGFAAMLNSTQATTLASFDGVISVFRSKMLKLHTTRSWDFMGLNFGSQQRIPLQLDHGDDIVVGILDSGIWPESGSFREEPGMPPVPHSWRGMCVKGEKFDPNRACNRKLVGARYYINGFEREYGPLNTTGEAEYRSPRDRIGHGTHTASTAVGSAATNASYFGLGRGTARGGAPRARLAVYKVCWFKNLEGKCNEADIMAAFDDALGDGVHVISASLGSPPPLMPFYEMSTEIGAFHAAQVGVAVVFSAGNDGPEPSMVQNVSPWSICVAAAAIDRTFPTRIILGNNLSIMRALNYFMMGNLFFSFSLFLSFTYMDRRMTCFLILLSSLRSCNIDKWNNNLAKGKIVLCFASIGNIDSTFAALSVLLAAKASGIIFVDSVTKQSATDDYLPSVKVDLHQGTQILYYIRSSQDPTVRILPSRTSIGRSPAPSVAYFSSRGPNSVAPNILKPDITAPGVNILASWSPKSSPTLLPYDRRSVDWNFNSGTSMSCPHISGIVALVRSVHPGWSPAMIKSALMTTAYMSDTSADGILAGGTLKATDAFDIGAGHVNPLKALDPGLVYDMEPRDYVIFLCSLGYTQMQIRNMLLPSPSIDTSCSGKDSDLELNYPAITVSDLCSTITIKRTLRNVGQQHAVYFARVSSPPGVHTIVWPKLLIFSWHKEKMPYYVTITPLKRSQGRYDFGEIVWYDGDHRVRTPLIVHVNNTMDGESSALQGPQVA
ncbi:subtilisin-like protease SBT3.18 isoform X1 [Canna indica]|uniref:Subtilisin-like protease SBT3.18 isoform X1 n=1 Tax=Canna indica TaxID=4628 RepID=A0AAQ3Q7B7_9LILI|nr:subtilisin-like protease SBT3.18 isoform X1 [Canna indica]